MAVISRPMAPLALLMTLATPVAGASGITCGHLKDLYASEDCCGSPGKELSFVVESAGACPYSFKKPDCNDAEPQSPRDLTAGARGEMKPKAATLNRRQAKFLPLVNVHYHLGAEHKAEAYSDDTDIVAWEAAHPQRRLDAGAHGAVQPGFMCEISDLNASQLAEYAFQYCKGEVKVGKSYEIHYVHSSAGYAFASPAERMAADIDGISDGLGGAANGRGMLNPMVVVQGQIFQIVQGGETIDDMVHGWTVTDHSNSVMYAGSTTGPSHTNEVCSPYSITWHVDKSCHRVTPESFDNMCKVMKENYDLEGDLYPHGSRKLLDPAFVVKEEYVEPLA